MATVVGLQVTSSITGQSSAICGDAFSGPPTTPFNSLAPGLTAASFPQGLTATASIAGPVAATTLSASGAISGTGFTNYLASPAPIGGTAAAAGTFTALTSTSYIATTTTTGISAAGTNVGTATALTTQINNVTTVAASTAGVVLPSIATVGVGGYVVVMNNGANSMHVYGGASDTVDGNAAATGVVLTNPKRCYFYAVAAATWISAVMATAAS